MSERVDIADYAEKIYANAERLRLWIDNRLVGMAAMYLNPEDRSGYITNVSVIAGAKGQGIAYGLCSLCLRYAQEQNLKSIVLEVGKENAAAIGLYEKLGFEMQMAGEFTLTLKLELATGPQQ